MQVIIKPSPIDIFLDPSKLEKFANDNFEFVENGERFSERVGNSGKMRNCSVRAIPSFRMVFSKGFYSREVKTKACFRKGQIF